MTGEPIISEELIPVDPQSVVENETVKPLEDEVIIETA